MWVRIVLRLSFKLEVENWRFTRRGLLYQYYLILSTRFQPTQTYSFPSSPPFSQKKFGGGAAKKPPNLESHLNSNDARL